MDGMDWWFEYFTDKEKSWLYHRSQNEINSDLTRDRFEQYFNRTEAEMADGIGRVLTVRRDANARLRVSYTDVRGKVCNPEVRWWVVRRIRSMAESSGRRPDPIATGGENNPITASSGDGRIPRPTASDVSLCTTVEEFFRRIEWCLRGLSPREQRAMFYDMRFSDQSTDALPDECAPTILEQYQLADGDLLDWWHQNPPNRRYQHRFCGKQRFVNCMLRRHGPQWRTYALHG